MGEYGVAINNRFALSVEEDDDLFEIISKDQEEKDRKAALAAKLKAERKEQQEKEEAKKASGQTTKGKGKSAKSNSKKILKTNDTNVVQQTNNRSTYTRNDENKPPRFAKQARDGPSDNQSFEKPPSDFDSGRRGGRGGMRGRGGPRGGFSSRPRRDFDRHSGSDKTGVKAVEKREGGGPHNWGDEIQAQLEQPGEQQTTPDQTLENGEDADGVETEPVDEGPKEMTLEEWKASQASKSNKPEFKVRKPNEGTDAKQWKGTVALQKKKKGDYSESEEEEEEEEYEYEEEVNETKATLEKLNIQITFAETGRGGGTRGGRGGRGRGGYGANPRGPRSGGRGRGGFDKRSGDKDAGPQLDDLNDFPTLGAK